MLTFEQMKELIELVARHRLAGVEVERSGFRLKVDGFRPMAAAAAAATAPSAPAAGYGPAGAGLETGAPASLPPPLAASAVPPQGLPVHAGETGAPRAPAASAKAAPAEAHHILTSPIVGTFYRAPSPDASPFTEVGARVRRGQVLCIIEAMKLMNEIESDVDGTIAEIYPQNAQAVEFGEPLFAIQPA